MRQMLSWVVVGSCLLFFLGCPASSVPKEKVPTAGEQVSSPPNAPASDVEVFLRPTDGSSDALATGLRVQFEFGRMRVPDPVVSEVAKVLVLLDAKGSPVAGSTQITPAAQLEESAIAKDGSVQVRKLDVWEPPEIVWTPAAPLAAEWHVFGFGSKATAFVVGPQRLTALPNGGAGVRVFPFKRATLRGVSRCMGKPGISISVSEPVIAKDMAPKMVLSAGGACKMTEYDFARLLLDFNCPSESADWGLELLAPDVLTTPSGSAARSATTPSETSAGCTSWTL